jgi:predicted kinase
VSNLLVPSVPQWSSGYPDVEPKRALSLAKKLGHSGLPGLYLEMTQTWPALRTAYGQTLDAVSSVQVEAPALDDETVEEARFNDLLAELLLGRRVGIAMADGVRSGFGEVLAQAFASHAFGFSVLVPYWQGRDDERGALESDSVLVVEPLAQASVNRWEPDLTSNDYAGLYYYTTSGIARRTNFLERDRFLLFTHRAIPGQYYGDGELRALVPLYHLLASVRRQQYQINQRSAGIVVAREGMGVGNENRAALESQLERFGDGEPWVVVPHGADFSVEFPSGSPPNLIEQIREIDAQALQMWASQMDVLGVSQTGSRAVADAMEAKAARVNANRIAPFVARVYERLGRWVAVAEGYTGRIREAVPVGLQEVDRGARVELLSKAVTGGLVSWTQEDEASLRDEVDMLHREAEEETRTLLVGQLVAAQQIISSLTPTDPTVAPIAPDAAKALLVAAGIPAESAESMIAAQVASASDRGSSQLAMLAKRPGPKSAAQTPAKPDERIEGSDTNPEGSASSTRGDIEISDEQEQALKGQIADYRERYPDAPKPDLGMLKAVYRRGAGAFSGSHRPGMTRAQWALARTRRFLTLLRGGKVKQAYAKADGDLLPDDHPAKLSMARVLTVYAGPPCAGKSETALRGKHGALIDVDDLLDELGGYYSGEASRQAHALALQDLDEAISRDVSSIAVVAPLLSERMRDEYAERAAAAGYSSRLVYVTAQLPVLEARNRKRSTRRLRMAALRAMAGEAPEQAAAFDTFTILDTSARPPQGVRDAARNGLERHRAGETGDGIEPSTIAAARRLAKGDAIGEDQLRKGARFWSRNERFLDAEPGSAGWASAQLWGGRAGMAWYRSQVDRLDRESQSELSECGCGSCGSSSAELAVEPPAGIIQTATGSMPHYRDGLEVSIRGVTVYPESWTTLETEADRRAARDAMFNDSLDEVIAKVTDEMEEAAEVSTERLDEVEVEAREQVADAIEAYYLDVRDDTDTARRVESQMQADTPVRGPGINLADEDAPRFGFSLARVREAAEGAARKIVADIRGRLDRFRVTTGSARGFRVSPSAKRGRAYTIDATPAANAIEAQGGDVEPPREGMVIVAAVRTSAKDNKVCNVCKGEDGRVFLFPEEFDEFDSYRQLPDPLCSSTQKTGGRSLCRCKFIYTWGFDE